MNRRRITGSVLRIAGLAGLVPVFLAAADGVSMRDAADDAATLAWVRMDGVPYAGHRYRWTGDSGLHVVLDVAPGAGQAIDLLWGSKQDSRGARIVINSSTQHVETGAHDGFRWLRVPVPAALPGTRLQVDLLPAPPRPALIAEIRLIGAGPVSVRPDLRADAHRAWMLRPWEDGAPPAEAFPGMRGSWDREPPAAPAGAGPDEPLFHASERNARRANEAFYRSRRFVDGWLAHADPATGLIPRNLRESVDYWNGRDSGADNYPFMVLTAAMTDRPLFEGRMTDMLRTEARLTCRIDRLPDDYSFSRKGWRREKADLETIVFEGAEYVKDGLLPITEWLGPSPWSERATGIVDDIWKNARIATPSGALPTLNFEVNGDLLQACSRLFWFTGDRKYLDWAIRLGDYYLLGDRHPARDMNEMKLGDHACEVINGLSELHVAVSRAEPAKREAYRKPLHELYDRILAVGVNAHGLMYSRINPKTGAVIDAGLTDNWGYNYDGLYTVFLLDGTAAYREAVRKALGCLKEHYTGQGGLCQSSTADGYADSIEGAITLYNRERVESATDWIDTEIGTMWSKQKPDGVIEGWHGDGNSARTSLMYALWKTQGVTIRPWRADVRFGAVENGGRLLLTFAADAPWQGVVIFDRPRHREFMKLPLDYPRINQFPEWFTAEAGVIYAVREAGAAAPAIHPGRALREGLPLKLVPGVETRWIVAATAGGT